MKKDEDSEKMKVMLKELEELKNHQKSKEDELQKIRNYWLWSVSVCIIFAAFIFLWQKEPHR